MNDLRNWLGIGRFPALAMAGMYLLICFVHSLLRNMKDSMVITAPGAGAEAIPFIQVWMLIPVTLLATYGFARLSDRLTQEKLFYAVIGAFLFYFILFGGVLYPLRETLHWDGIADELAAIAPLGLRGGVTMVRHWTFSLFYTVSELWSCMVTSVLFWGMANQITRLDMAKRTYGLYAIGGNLGMVLAGIFPQWLTGWSAVEMVYLLVMLVVIASLGVVALFRSFAAGSECSSLRERTPSKPHATVWEEIQELYRSPYLRALAVMVLAYNVVLNFGELVWKDQLRLYCPDFGDYNAYLGVTSVAIGACSIFLSAMLPRILDWLGWKGSALVTPIVLCGSAGLFLCLLYFGDLLPIGQQVLLQCVVLSGAVMDAVGRIAKHTVFDATKDMAFIPLEQGVKLKGKAAVDGAVSRLGRSAAAFAHQLLIFGCSGIFLSVPIVIVVVAVAFVSWVRAVCCLDGLKERYSAGPSGARTLDLHGKAGDDEPLGRQQLEVM
jgi:AAA family ATP:ADP antiporter